MQATHNPIQGFFPECMKRRTQKIHVMISSKPMAAIVWHWHFTLKKNRSYKLFSYQTIINKHSPLALRTINIYQQSATRVSNMPIKFATPTGSII